MCANCARRWSMRSSFVPAKRFPHAIFHGRFPSIRPIKHNFSTKTRYTPEGMDSAQLAQNLAQGKGHTTQCIRPLTLYLVQSHNQEKGITFGTNAASPDFARIKTVSHPDIANPPVYPVMLAGLMK